MQATQPYLMVPIQNGTPYAYLTVRDANNNVLYRQRMRIAEDGMDRCLPVYIGSLSGQQITVTAGHTYTSGPYASAIHLSATPELDPVPDPDRPVYHHTPAYGWMNDPNGLIYHNGRYHLFYQHDPYDTHWNNMHWGHAVSTDLIHWEELPIVFYPDEYGDMFSGSMVVDEHNTAGFGSGAFVAIYTSTAPRQAQNIAYSLDEGMTWRKLGAPVLWGDGDFRDPKVFWHDGRQCWLMALANGFQTQVYSSVNLRDWNWEMGWGGHVGQHPGTW
ncbi:MAG: glycoside hydrolase family 32 protein, partial [Paludibacteraceae bacterium]|nr:glycoside hydrolase family 32 protein [Paludibacteraceae bacterium]